jgi:hypothetical protein
VTSLPVFILVRTLELEVDLGDAPLVLRVEILEARHQEQLYRARLWRRELYRMVPSFPRGEDDEPSERTDDTMFVEWPELLQGEYDAIVAQSADAAEEKVLDDLRHSLAAAAWAV